MSNRACIVYLDSHTLNPGDLGWAKLQALGKLTLYEYTPAEEIVQRAEEADILIVNKTPISAETLARLPKLRGICITATGYNIVDVAAAKERGIPVCNVSDYGTHAVAQHVFALILALLHRVEAHNNSVQLGDWARSSHFSYTLYPQSELEGKTMGIYGFGAIGQRVGEIAHAFGMTVLSHHKHPERDARPWVTFVSLPELFQRSNVVSLHAPLTEDNQEVVNHDLLSLLPVGSLLINTARGGLIREADLREALLKGPLAGAGLDVLSTEPPPADHPLYGLDNCLITPHMAWTSREARERLLNETAANVSALLHGQPRNVVG